MIYKKTWLSYFLWAAYTCLTGVMLANYAILFWQKKINAVINYGTALFVVFMFGAAAGIYILVRYIFGKVREKYSMSGHTKLLWEIFIALSIFCAGLIYRVSLYLQNINSLAETSYYQLATVKAEPSAESMVHGASYLYTMCLSFILSFLGNKVAVAVWMQILIQMVTVFLAYFAVRRLAGRIPACIAMLVLAVSSVYAGQILVMSPESLFFALYLAGLLIVGGCVKNVCQGRTGRWQAFGGAVLSGFIVGFLTYLDAIAVTLVIFLFSFLTGKKYRETAVSLIAGGLTFAGMLALNAYSDYTEIGKMAKAWFELYRTNASVDYLFYRTEFSVVECLVLVMLAFWLIMAFWNRRKTQNVTPWFLLLFLLAPTPLAATGVLSYQAWSVFLWGVVAGIGVQQSFVYEKDVPIKQEASVESEPVTEEEAQPEKPRFLDNPLPLPKKHEKRTMDYQYEVGKDMMKFDIEIAENDDFDIL